MRTYKVVGKKLVDKEEKEITCPVVSWQGASEILILHDGRFFEAREVFEENWRIEVDTAPRQRQPKQPQKPKPQNQGPRPQFNQQGPRPPYNGPRQPYNQGPRPEQNGLGPLAGKFNR